MPKKKAPAAAGISESLRNEIRDAAGLFKMLADPNRLTICVVLAKHGETNVSKLCEILEQSQPAVSHHLALLRASKLALPRREGKNNLYAIENEQVRTILADAGLV